jgi:UDP-N-acetylglucosamine pyrophosphorylase
VGVVAKKNGNYYIVEYSELSENHANALQADGKTLFYRQGSILVFIFNAKFLLELSINSESSSLYHKAFKKIQYCDL